MEYYNENNTFCGQWLENLASAGHIGPGRVDKRDIRDVRPTDLSGFTRCHFFAGIGVWSYALRLAGWPNGLPVWTGSCPCQPFSRSGKRRGFDDERHLWPEWFRLIAECRPFIVVGEQVADKGGRAWFDAVQTEMEAIGYTIGAVIIPACGFGAPHIRERLYWLAYAASERLEVGKRNGTAQPSARQAAIVHGAAGWLGVADSDRREPGQSAAASARYGDSTFTTGDVLHAAPVNGWWSDADWLACSDGRFRAVKPGSFPLAHGTTGRVGRLRAYGNAIVAPQAAEFLRAVIECLRPKQ